MKADVILITKSNKIGKFCVLAVDVNTGKIIRLVTTDEKSHGGIPENYFKYISRLNGNTYQYVPLDEVIISLAGARPLTHQTENYLIDEQIPWDMKRKVKKEELFRLCPPQEKNTIFHSVGPYLSELEMSQIHYSVEIISAHTLQIKKFDSPNGKPKFKANFKSGETFYQNYAVTDPKIDSEIIADHAVLIVSLPEYPYPTSNYYKFVAKIFLI